MIAEPVYINCFFFDRTNRNEVYIYMIEGTSNSQYPFQLFKQRATASVPWEDLSVHASISDAVRVLLKQLLPDDLAEEIYYGQASVDPRAILDRLKNGDKSVSLFFSVDSSAFKIGRDVSFGDMIRRQI